MFDPWNALDGLTGWTLRSAPTPSKGLCDHAAKTIILDPGLTTAEHRSVLTHELVHARRGPVPRWLRAREEATVQQISARLLIDMPDLADAAAWSRHIAEVADELDVDIATVHTRAATLRTDEQAILAERLRDIHLP